MHAGQSRQRSLKDRLTSSDHRGDVRELVRRDEAGFARPDRRSGTRNPDSPGEMAWQWRGARLGLDKVCGVCGYRGLQIESC
jgi:hypothetical protein